MFYAMVIKVDVCEETGDIEGASFSSEQELNAFLEEARRRLKREIVEQRRIISSSNKQKHWNKILDQMLLEEYQAGFRI